LLWSIMVSSMMQRQEESVLVTEKEHRGAL